MEMSWREKKEEEENPQFKLLSVMTIGHGNSTNLHKIREH